MKSRAELGIAVLLLLVSALASSACKEGQGVIVRRLMFEGVHSVPEADLRLVITTAGSGRLPWSPKTYFSRQEFTDDLKRLESFYASRGFPDARVRAFRTTYNTTRTEMDLTVVIDEGFPTVIERVDLAGFDALPPEHVAVLREKIALEAGQPRDQERVEIARGMALDEWHDHGYPLARVAVAETRGTDARRVVVVFTATAGAFATFGDVNVQGNRYVSAEVIRRQMAFQAGEAFSQSALQTSQRRLYGLELFQFANVEADTDALTSPAGPTSVVPVKVTVVEGPHRQYSVGVGWGSEEHARVEATWRHLNFLGGARTAGVEGRFSSLDRGVRVSFTEPSIGGGVSLGGSGQTWYANTPAYTLRTSGGRVALLRALSSSDPSPGSRARSSVSLSLARERESYRVSDAALADATFRPTLIALGLNPQTGEGSGTVAAVTADVQHNTVANLLDARRGSLLSVHGEWAARVLGGDFAYREVSGEARTYAPLLPALTLALHARAGAIGSDGDATVSVPFFKRYFVGGATSLRGWGRFEVAPLTSNGLPIGGFSMLESSAELRLTPESFGALGLVGFLDAGNVWDRSWRWDLNDLRADLGAGVRYQTPVGPVRLDVAYQLTPNEALVIDGGPAGSYRRWRFHFSIGQAF